MTLDKKDLKKLEMELTVLKKIFDKSQDQVRETSGSKKRFRYFILKSRIQEIEGRLEDLRKSKIRTDEITPEETEIEKRIVHIETKLGITKRQLVSD